MDLTAALKSGGDRISSRGPGAGERVLLVVQVAASLSLVASAGLILKSVSALDRRDPGFDADRVMAFSVAEDLAVQRPGSGPVLVDRLLSGLRGSPRRRGDHRGAVHAVWIPVREARLLDRGTAADDRRTCS